MKTAITSLVFSAVLSAGPSLADSQHYYDWARVQDVRPLYKTVEHRVPREHCWQETVRVERPRHDSATSTLVGGLVGGAIGHAVGRGKDNKKIGTAVGAALGMSIGHDIGHQRRQYGNDVSYRDVERCEVNYSIEREERLSGYEVTYQYQGQSYTTTTQEHPGKRIKLAVSVRPMP